MSITGVKSYSTANLQGANSSSNIADLTARLTLDEVTPELAAQIVKHYILPMFDSDGRKALKRKATRGKSSTHLGQNNNSALSQENGKG